MIQKRSQVRFWSAYARVYDGLLELRPYADLIAGATDALELDSEAVVVDLGCGTGNCMNAVLSSKGSKVRRIIGVDSSPQMLSTARRKLGSRPEVELVQESLLDWLEARPPRTVDAAISVNVLYTMGPADRQRFWEGLARVLTDGGSAVVVTTDRAGFGPVAREHLARVPVWRAFSFRLLAVLIMNMFIWLFESTEKYDPVDLDRLMAEAESAGLTVSRTERCYGGEEDGVDVMLVMEMQHIDLSAEVRGEAVDPQGEDRPAGRWSPEATGGAPAPQRTT